MTQCNRPRILWVTNLAPPYRRYLWQRLGRTADLRVGLLASSEPNRTWDSRTPDSEYELIRLPSLPMGPSGLSRHLYFLTSTARSILSSAEPDVVMLGSYESPAYQSILRAAHAARIPAVLWYESHSSSHRFNRGFVPWLRKRTIDQVDAVLAVGRSAYTSALSQATEKRKILGCNHIVDFPSIRRAVDHERRSRAGEDLTTGHRFLYVGQLIERKNILSLVEAFRKTANRDDELLIVGDGPQRREIESAGTRLHTGKVRLVGHKSCSDLWRLFSSSHTLVLPSTNEVFGQVALEGLAADLHVVVARRTGVAADISGRPGVYVCEPTVEAIAEMLKLSRDDWRGPKKLSMAPFGVEQMVTATCDAVLIALGSHSRHAAAAPLWR